MLLLPRAAPIVALVLLVAACSATPAASPAGTASGPSPAASAGVSPAATPAATTPAASTAALSAEGIGGTWTFVASNPRVVSATGPHAGGSVVIEGNRYRFTAGDFSSEGPIEFVGTKEVTCTARACKIEGVPLYQVFLVNGELAIQNAGMLTPLGSFGDQCAWEDVPDGGVVIVESTGTVAGQVVPSVVRFADGAAGGVGTECEQGSHVVAWDITATRAQ